MTTQSNAIIKQWLDDLAFSAATWDLEAHMALISTRVEVIGIPGVAKIDYQGWKRRRNNEFKKKLLHSLHYRKPVIVSEGSQSITFSVLEVMKDHTKQCIELEKIVTLHREEDQRWRVVHEQIINIDIKRVCATA